MTVISTIISRICTTHATDSLISRIDGNGKYEVISDTASKILLVPQWSGIISFWGTALVGSDWNIHEFLRTQITLAQATSSAEKCAEFLCDALNRIPAIEINGVGIHFTAYENVNGLLIPELFQLTNYLDTSYSQLDKNGVQYRRETYAKIADGDESPRSTHGREDARIKVYEFIQSGNLFIYNNGDPVLFNLARNGIFELLDEAIKRNLFRPLDDPAEQRSLTGWPIEQVINLQERFFIPGKRIVGGLLHNYSVTSTGVYESDTEKG